MTIWIALLGGIILGWVIEWIIDFVYWRRGVAAFYANEEDLRGQISSVQQQYDEAVAESTGLRSQLASANTDLESSKSALESATASIEALEQQKAAVEQQNAETVTEVTGLRSQLENSSTELTSRNLALATATAAIAALEQQKSAIEQQNAESVAEIAGLRSQLENSNTEVESSNAAVADASAAIAALEQEKAALEQQLQEARDSIKTAMQSRRDDLEQIDGIGRVYEQKLFDAGIDTFARLAITPAERLKEIIQPASWQHTDFESWIEQARKSAEVVIYDALPYRLEEIRGIGPVYAKRLNAEGIMTYSDLAHTPEKRLREIIAPKRGLTLDFADWIKQARAFVALTVSDRPPLPLERIKGIGPVFATRLDLAGIHSYADLANASEENLREIIGHRGMQIANLSRWIAEAKAEVDEEQARSSNSNAAEESNGASEPRGGQDETVSA